ncbi:hypothetical protein MNB_SV-14-515 [hydrothermal vent metagenome]|uniref:Metal-independent alpha-mannosidase n=1 Tax=hydrothermal vent metagenome TaxID=652676 RepID=A0A1W1CRG1_9ZZZZ
MNRKYFKLLIIITTMLLATSTTSAYTEFSKENKIDSKILGLWSQSKKSFEYSIKTLKNSPLELYFIGSESFNILNYSFQKKDSFLIEELLQLYLKTIPYIKKEKNYVIYELNENEEKSKIVLNKPIYIWSYKNGDEEVIASSQFLFVISFAVYKISLIPNEQRSKTMNEFIRRFSPILLSHYKRWVLGVKENGKEIKLGSFSRRGWGCKDKEDNYIYARTLNKMITELDNNSYHGASYCNVIADPSLLTIAGLGYYLAGEKNQEKSTNKTIEELNSFFIKSIKILSKKFKKSTIKDLNNRPIDILTFQEGAWYGHPNYEYSDYNGLSFPKEKDKKSSYFIGRDVSHGSRLLYLLEMLVATKDKFNIEFPTSNDMEMFTNSFYYRVFNQDLKRPLFKNYLNGSNGWFRVNYDSRKGYGYAPYQIGSLGALLGGYPRLAKYNNELEKVFITLFKKFNSIKKEDREFINKFYAKSIWMEGKEREVYHFYTKDIDIKTSIFLINFYSSLL